MTVWIDAQLPPNLVGWLRRHFDLEALHVFEAGLLTGEDHDIFHAARSGDDIILTKDADFIDLVQRHGPPPKIIQVGCGNCTNRELFEILRRTLSDVLKALGAEKK